MAGKSNAGRNPAAGMSRQGTSHVHGSMDKPGGSGMTMTNSQAPAGRNPAAGMGPNGNRTVSRAGDNGAEHFSPSGAGGVTEG